MEDHQFDSLTRMLARNSNRRLILRGAIACAFGPLGLRFRNARAQAPATCGGNCYSVTLIDGSSNCANTIMGSHGSYPPCSQASDCSTDRLCSLNTMTNEAVCVPNCPNPEFNSAACTGSQVACGSVCADLTNDLLNCGKCGFPCGGGELPWGHANACIDGQCQVVCAHDADYCGETCTDLQWDGGNCGDCGVICGENTACCGGRCVDRSASDRFCGGCGMYAGFPQGCNADETCEGGLYARSSPEKPEVFAADATIGVVVVGCPVDPSLIEPPPLAGTTSSWLKLLADAGNCVPLDGIIVKSLSADGQGVSCTTSQGVCTLSVGDQEGPLTVTQSNPPDSTKVEVIPSPHPGGIFPGVAVVSIVNVGTTISSGQGAPSALPTEGQLAYSVKNDGHWNIWLHDFQDSRNRQLTREPKSDQWAPSWSHGGSRLAYLSDQTDGTNQVWLMDPDGKNQTQLTDYHGDEAIAYVVWSPADDQLIVTLSGKQGDRLVTMPSEGGAFNDFIAAPASFACTTSLGHLSYTTIQNGVNAIQITSFDLNNQDGFIQATLAVPGIPLDAANLNSIGSAVIFQGGQMGSRQINYLIYTHNNGQQLPQVRADDSNPVWLGAGMAFVSDDGSTQTLIICRSLKIGRHIQSAPRRTTNCGIWPPDRRSMPGTRRI